MDTITNERVERGEAVGVNLHKEPKLESNLRLTEDENLKLVKQIVEYLKDENND
jgi:hypothetical protein